MRGPQQQTCVIFAIQTAGSFRLVRWWAGVVPWLAIVNHTLVIALKLKNIVDLGVIAFQHYAKANNNLLRGERIGSHSCTGLWPHRSHPS